MVIPITTNTRIFSPKNPPKDQYFLTVFHLGKCPTCGGEVKEIDSYGFFIKEKGMLLALGAKEIDYLPPEILWNDRTKKHDCEKCRKLTK